MISPDSGIWTSKNIMLLFLIYICLDQQNILKMKKLHLEKITVSKLSKDQCEYIIGGSVECPGDITKDRNDPKCDDFTHTNIGDILR